MRSAFALLLLLSASCGAAAQPADCPTESSSGPTLPLAGSWTLERFSARLASLDLFPAPPGAEVYRNYRAWGFEAAALDLALRQAGRSLHDALGRRPHPVSFVASVL